MFLDLTMEKKLTKNDGLKLLLKKYRKIFRIPENLDYYSEKDYQGAERKFLKYALLQGKP
jgi:hypothetical protein